MSRYLWWMIMSVAAISAGCVNQNKSEGVYPDRLRCEHRIDPMGVDVKSPRLGWIVTSQQANQLQSAYQIVVGSNHDEVSKGVGELWDTGKVPSDETVDIAYAGKPLASHQRVFWAVRSWDRDGRASAWSKPAEFTAGLLDESEWKAKWIGLDAPRAQKAEPADLEGAKWIMFAEDAVNNAPPGDRVYMTQLEIPKDAVIESAIAIASGDDHLHFTVNGALTAYRNQPESWRHAMVMDLKDHVHPGVNHIRVSVKNTAQGPTGLIARIVVTLAGGKKIELHTDDSWRATAQPGDNWHNRDIAADAWPKAKVVGEYGVQPWGKISTNTTHTPPTVLLRKDLQIAKPVKRALIYTTALGNSDLYLNGQRVSDEYFTPGWTDYAKRVYYRTFDVTSKLKRGANAIGVELADGWFAGYVGFGAQRDHYGKKTRAAVQLLLEYTDGSVETIVTDETWKASTGPTLFADFLMGESYDARKEIANWSNAGIDDAQWSKVDVGTNEVSPKVQWHPAPPVVAFEEFRPTKMTQVAKGVHVLDLGQNFAGVVRLRIEGAKQGQEITLRHAERLNPDGTIYTTNLRAARATDTYICTGSGVEEWSPRFTFHGFQYVEVTGLDEIKPDTVVGLALSSDTPVVGTFDSSDAMLNRLHKNIYYTQRSNFIDIPTDCPQRDERLGWTADAQVYLSAGALNCDVQSFFTKWLLDLIDSQREDGQFPMVAPLKVAGDDGGPAWADAGTIAPWTIYQIYGDKRLLERQYPSMKKFVEFCKHRSPNLLPPEKFHCFGDWLSINANTPNDVIYEAFFAESTRLTAQAAEVLGKTEDAKELWKLHAAVKDAFNKAYVSADGRIKGDTQTCYVLALDFDLVDGANREAAARYLIEDIEKKNWHLSTGFVGTKTLMNVLSKIGRPDVAYRLLHNETFPSWGFSVKQGATSIWERWDGWTPEKGFQDPGMNSFAHYAFGAVYQWMVANIGGIREGDVGYKKIIIAPEIDPNLSFAKVTYDSVRGPIRVEWKKTNSSVEFEIEIPVNTTATVVLPTKGYEKVTRDGGAIQSGVERTKVDLGSGINRFVLQK